LRTVDPKLYKTLNLAVEIASNHLDRMIKPKEGLDRLIKLKESLEIKLKEGEGERSYLA